jgi:ABC-2 type transport system ATP-binding protein
MTTETMMNTVWEGKSMHKSFGAGQFGLVVDHLSLPPGEITGLVGENGHGKTTLLRIIAGDLSIDSGKIMAWGKELSPFEWRAYKEQIAYIPQRIPRWFGFLKTNLLFQAATHGIAPEKIVERIDTLLSELGLTPYAHLKWTEISTGYRLRFELARMLISQPKFIILDEPIANLDINAQEKFLTDLRRIVKNPQFETAVILSSQHLHQVEAYSDNIIFIKNGAIEFSGRLADIGKTREVNTFELAGTFNQLQLKSIPNVTLKTEKGNVFIIETPLELDAKALLTTLLEQNFTIHYFRDISSSTKKMFQS